jgi:hypothetical protein
MSGLVLVMNSDLDYLICAFWEGFGERYFSKKQQHVFF